MIRFHRYFSIYFFILGLFIYLSSSRYLQASNLDEKEILKANKKVADPVKQVEIQSEYQTQPSTSKETKLTRAEQNKIFLQTLKKVLSLSDESMEKISSIFNSSSVISQGNPNITVHPMSPAQCLEKLKKNKIEYYNPKFEKICHHKYMAPLYDPSRQTMEEATTCIDQFEFPSIPCEYPLVWTKASEAVAICEAMGKRLCDAHEWEGACEGRLLPPDYIFEKNLGPSDIQRLRGIHNKKVTQSYSYGGSVYKKGICGASSFKSKNCNGGDWSQCGSNTYPVGSFPECRSSLMVYDIHGNAAEHMNLPLSPEQMASHPSHQYGHTEMKGSWFIFDTYKAHPDWCRWRAPYWHGTRVLDPKSHHNYHLGFRCCVDIPKKTVEKNKDLK